MALTCLKGGTGTERGDNQVRKLIYLAPLVKGLTPTTLIFL